MNVELRNHPAQARHPVTDAPLFEGDGKTPVPMITDQKMVMLEGFQVGYITIDGPGRGSVQFTRNITDAVAQRVAEAARQQAGIQSLFTTDARVAVPPSASRIDAALQEARERDSSAAESR